MLGGGYGAGLPAFRCAQTRAAPPTSLSRLPRQGLTDLRTLGGAAHHLVALNLSCNALASLRGLAAAAPRLARLNVQRNHLTALDDLAGLRQLASLNAGGNRVARLAPLAALTALSELALHRNAVADAAQLDVLAALPRLRRLALAGNPLTRGAPAGTARAATLALLGPGSGLEILDSARVTAAERAAAAAGAGGAAWGDVVAAAAAAAAEQQQPRAVAAAARGPGDGGSGAGAGGAAATRSRPSGSVVCEGATLASAVQGLPALSLAPTKPSSLCAPDAAAAAAAAARREPPVIWFTARHANGMPGVTLRKNGSGSFSWPSGGLAASADLDAAGGYRLLAMFDAGGRGGAGAAAVAFSADAGGGFAQYADGRPALRWRRGESVTHHGPSGEVLASWRKRAPRLQADIRQGLGQGLSVAYSAASGDCSLLVDLAPHHPSLAWLALTQQRGAALEEGGGGGEAPEVPAPTPAAAAEAAPPVPRPPAACPARAGGGSGGAKPSGAAAAPAAAQVSVEGGGAEASAAPAASSAPAPLGGDLTAVLARAKALMARTAAEERQEAEQRQGATAAVA